MATKTLISKAEVKKSKIHGWGVFAKHNIKKGNIIEECLFLKTPKEINKNPKDIRDYLFDFYGCSIIILGYGSIYNHSDNPNAKYITDAETSKIIFVAKKDIRKGQEIFTSYSKRYWTDRGILPKVTPLAPKRKRMK